MSCATHTAREIAQQPALWSQVAQLVSGDQRAWAFLEPLIHDPSMRVVLTGAGTSSYIGECLAPTLMRRLPGRVQAIATTDLVASPATWFESATRTLLVSFARSGNSPESVAAVDLAERLVSRCAHLIVTCNGEGELYRRSASLRSACALLLPPAANDQSFAMTSSFSGMLLAAATALGAMPAAPERMDTLGGLAAQVLDTWVPLMQELAGTGFERVVYLGSNELKALARESSLKMLELTDGQVVSVADSPLGFRHGPKTIVNGRTLIVMFLSNDAHTRRYELDLLCELRGDGVAGRIVALSNRADLPQHPDNRLLVPREAGAADPLGDLDLCLPYVVFAQSLAMLRSLSLGLSPDLPNAAGTVNRVVQGVTIHAFGSSR
ncbi:MAG: SIS domain-containing protein [Steroidobacteraceae bacterium]